MQNHKISQNNSGALLNLRQERRSFEFRSGQIIALLKIHPVMTTHDIAREVGITPRQAFGLCRKMAEQGTVTAEQTPHANHFKWLIRLA